LDNSSVIKLRLLTRALNIFITSGREAADTPLSAEHFTIMLCDLQRSWMKVEISIAGAGVLWCRSWFLFCVVCRGCVGSRNSHITDV